VNSRRKKKKALTTAFHHLAMSAHGDHEDHAGGDLNIAKLGGDMGQ